MKLDLTRLFDCEGEAKEFSCDLDLSEVKRWGSKLFSGPVKIFLQSPR